jgi:hypothetical protein
MKASNAGDYLCVVLLAAFCLYSGLPRYRSGLDLGDEGLLSYGAVRVMDGQMPNRDFVTLQPPLSFYSAAAVFKVFGTSLVSLRILGLSIYVLIPLLTYGIARQFNDRVLSLAAAMPAMVLGISFAHFVPVAVWQGVTVVLGAALLFLLATAGPGRRCYLGFPAGLLTGSAMLLRQDQGFYLALAVLVYAAALKFAKAEPAAEGEVKVVSNPNLKAALGLWVCGMLLVLGGFGIYSASAGAAGPMFRQLVLFPVTTYAKTSSLPFPSLRSALTLGPGAAGLLYYAPPILGLVSGIWLAARIARGGFRAQEAKIVFLLAWSELFYCQVLVRSDMDHLLITLAPFLILLASCFGGFLDWLSLATAGRPSAARLALQGVASALAAGTILGFVLLLRPVFLPPPVEAAETLALERGGICKKGASNLKKFIERVQGYAPRDQSILCLPYQPMFYFLAERRNPTKWNYLWPGDQTAEDHGELIRQARSDPPAVIVVTGEMEMARYAQDILDYVHTDYTLAANAGGMFLVYVPVANR